MSNCFNQKRRDRDILSVSNCFKKGETWLFEWLSTEDILSYTYTNGATLFVSKLEQGGALAPLKFQFNNKIVLCCGFINLIFSMIRIKLNFIALYNLLQLVGKLPKIEFSSHLIKFNLIYISKLFENARFEYDD